MRNILWTGGLDSTYLLCKCARESDEAIQPIYVIFREHACNGSTDRDIDTQDALLPLIRAKDGIIAEIKDPIRLLEKNIPDADEFTEAYERNKKDAILSEHGVYRAFGKVAHTYPDLMIGIEAPAPGTREIGRIETSLNNYGLTISDDGTVVCADDGNKDMYTIWGGLIFPMIRVNAAQELEAFEEWGYSDLPALTRTCVTGLDFQCGVCGNCETKMKYGDTFKDLMPRGYVNHKIKEYLQTLNTDYGTIYTSFIWHDETLVGGVIDTHSDVAYVSTKTAQNYVNWFNALRKAYPDFDSVNKADYGL